MQQHWLLQVGLLLLALFARGHGSSRASRVAAGKGRPLLHQATFGAENIQVQEELLPVPHHLSLSSTSSPAADVTGLVTTQHRDSTGTPPDPGLELWKAQVEATVQQELAQETKFMNQLMEKQTASDQRQAKLEQALKMLIAHYKGSQSRAHKGEVALHKLAVWAHKTHDELEGMESHITGKVQEQGDRIDKISGRTGEAFDVLGAAGDEASAQIDDAHEDVLDDEKAMADADNVLDEASAQIDDAHEDVRDDETAMADAENLLTPPSLL